MYTDTAIRETRPDGNVAIIPRQYSPVWWDENKNVPSSHRQRAQRHRPYLCIIHDASGARAFVAFGGRDGMTAALDLYLGQKVVQSSLSRRD